MVIDNNAVANDDWGPTTWSKRQVPTLALQDRVTGKTVYELGAQAVMCCFAGGCCKRKGRRVMDNLKLRVQGFIAQ